MQRISASKLVSAQRCPAADVTTSDAYKAGLPRNVGGDAAALGKAYHHLHELAAAGEDVRPGLIAIVSDKFGVPRSELAFLWRVTPTQHGKPTWQRAEWSLELPLDDGWILRGRCDLARFWEESGTLEVIDWKTGQPGYDVDAASHPQLKAYAVMSTRSLESEIGFGKLQRVRAVLHYVRDFEHPDALELTIDQVNDIEDEVRALCTEVIKQHATEPVNREYRVGSMCRFCDGRYVCPAYQASIRDAIKTFDSIEVSAGNAIALYERQRLVSAVADKVEIAVKDFVERNGPLRDASGRILEFRESARGAPLSNDAIEAALEAEGYPKEVTKNVLARLKARPKRISKIFGLYKGPRAEE